MARITRIADVEGEAEGIFVAEVASNSDLEELSVNRMASETRLIKDLRLTREIILPINMETPAMACSNKGQLFVNPAFNSNRYQDHAVNAYTTYNPASSPQVAAGAEPDVLNGQVGQKRKHEDGTGGIPSGSWKQSQGGSRPTFYHPMKKNNNNNNNVPKVQAAPAVPSFGGPLPVPLKPQAFASSPKTSSSTQRKKNLLGLVPQGAEPEESDEEEDVDEEAVYASSSGEPLSFELNGEVCTLSSPAEIKAWIEERRKLWPSKLRIEEKNREVRARMEERKRIQEEAQAAAAASTSLRQHSDSSRQQQKQRKKTRDAQASGSHLERTKKELEKQMKKVEQLQTLLAQNGKRPEKLGVTQSQADDFPQGRTLTVSAWTMNKLHHMRLRTRIRCQFHLLLVPLVEQEKEEENRLALQAIKYLGSVGFFSKR
ncbi:hypothetical protein H2203_003643 [Taxawa tesnikishii (nom. ined.)]|nr:hypothetical protein H2203_003643 [Dothideales sp. JES 119]